MILAEGGEPSRNGDYVVDLDPFSLSPGTQLCLIEAGTETGFTAIRSYLLVEDVEPALGRPGGRPRPHGGSSGSALASHEEIGDLRPSQRKDGAMERAAPVPEYVYPVSVAEAVTLLTKADGAAALLAGGQGLQRSTTAERDSPRYLVDLGRIEELRGVREDGDELVIGAMTTHHELLCDPLVREYTALLAAAAATLGDQAVRQLGTVGGALATADSAGDLPAVVLALDAMLVVQGPDGRRRIAAQEFFDSSGPSALSPQDVLLELRVPKLRGPWRAHYAKFQQLPRTWAVVGVGIVVRRDNGTVGAARIGLTNVSPVPVRASVAEAALAGMPATAEVVADAVEVALDDVVSRWMLTGPEGYLSQLARVLTKRTITTAAGLWEPAPARPIEQLPEL